MAYGRRYVKRGRRSYRRRKNYSTSARGWGNIARRALKTAQFVAGLVNVEKKFVDTQIARTAATNASYVIYPLNLCAQGDDENMRNGRSILSKSLQLRLQLLLTNAQSGIIRIVVFRDKAAEGVVPSMADLYAQTNTDLAVTSFRNLLTGAAQRYDVLWSKTVSMDQDTKSQIIIDKYWKLKNHIHYITTGNNQASLGNGALYMAVIGTGATATDAIEYVGTARLRYIDN